MVTKISSVALFRLSVIGPLASRDKFEHGELKRIIRELASKSCIATTIITHRRQL